jgi:asparagine synthase (glutamine-hydrolysing)
MTELAGITVNGRLIPEADWKAMVTNLQSITQQPLRTEAEQIAELKTELIGAVKRRVAGAKFGVLLSGGVDSSLLALLCKQIGKEFTCYTVGIEGSPDLIAARNAAQLLGLQLKQRIYTKSELEQLFHTVAKLLPRVDVVSVGVGTVVLAAAQLAKEDGITVLMGGLGSEEIFAGYERHAQSADVNAECWAGLFNMHARDFVRDAAIAHALQIQFLTPFLDPAVISTAMRIPGTAKIVSGEKKVILRKMAAAIGLPQEIAYRKKQAAQYGSKFDAVLEKCAKQDGLGKQAYVAALVN